MYGLIAGLILAIIASIEFSRTEKFNIVGDYALSLLGKSKEAEKALFYIDQSAKYSLQQAVYEIAKNGGVSEIEEAGTDEGFADYECGKFKDSYVWYEIKKTESGYDLKECFDESAVSSYLMQGFNENMDEYISSAPKEMPTDNYIYDIKDDSEIIGTAKLPIKFNVLRDDEEVPLPPLKPRQYKVDSEGKAVEEKKTAEGKETPKDTAKLKSLVDFSGVSTATLGKETIDITGLCEKGNRCSLTNEAYQLLLKAHKIAKQKGIYLQVTQGYRSKQEQINIWEGKTAMRWAQRIPDETKRRAKVCYPYGDDVENRCAHLSGNAVDIRFKGKTFDTMTGADWRELRNIMTSAEWIWYGDEKDLSSTEKNPKRGELWHFECCGTLRAKRAEEAGVTAIV